MSNYNVTLKSSDDLDGFYADMENDGGSGNVPQRAVTVVNRRPISRNTEYDLEDAEATELANDSRVLAVEAVLPEGAVTVRPSWEQDGNFSKSNSLLSNNVNWGILRCLRQEQIPNWGSNNTQNIFDTVQCTASGRNVDVVIVDGFLQTDNPQLAENADGTGNSRVTQEDWGQFRNAVDGGANFNYQYTTGTANLNNGDDNHGIHVAGTVCGQTQGFARDANIFNISPYGSVTQPGNNPNAVNGVSGTTCYDYIREWHTQKVTDALAANEIPRPTIINNSWGSSVSPLVTEIIQVNFQGAVTAGPFTEAQLEGFGLTNIFTDQDGDRRVGFEFWSAATETDTIDAINAGIIMVGAAGNADQLMDVPGGANFDNTVTFSFNGQGPFTQLYHRGSANITAGNAICVGAMGAFQVEAKASFSQCGPRIDVWAPGVNITSSLAGTDSGDPANPFTVVQDPLNNAFLLGKLQGTSMASPQVCGILACWLEQNPRATQADCVEFLQKNSSRPDQIAAGTNGGFTDVNDLQGAPRDVLCFDFLRPSSVSPTAGDIVAFPSLRYGAREDDGMLFPRNNRIVEEFTGGGGGGRTVTLTSPAFNDGDALENGFWYDQVECPGSNDSPELNWAITGDAAPAGSTWRLSCVDLDGGPWTHWTVTTIPNATVTIAQNGNFPAGSTVGQNDWDINGLTSRANGWGGPCPPGGTGLHRYQFQIELMDADGVTVLTTSNTLTSNITA